MAYALGSKSRQNLIGVHPRLIAVVERAIQITSQDFTVFEGVRTPARQRLLFNAGKSKTLKSNHFVHADGFGHAVDLVPWVQGRAQWLWPEGYKIAQAMHVAADDLGVDLRWGGVWDRRLKALDLYDLRGEVHAYAARHAGPDLLDAPHFEL